jgi:hypothetical protein
MQFLVGQPAGSRHFLFLRYSGLELESLKTCVFQVGKRRSAISTLMLIRSFVMTEIYSVLKAYLFSLKKLCFLEGFFCSSFLIFTRLFVNKMMILILLQGPKYLHKKEIYITASIFESVVMFVFYLKHVKIIYFLFF